MAANAGSVDAWRIAGEDRAKHDSQFFTLKPVNGYVTGEQARGFFMQSGLPTPVLGQIWGLADMNNDGKMDKKEFSIAMHLIKKKLQGYELPKSLPTSLKADPSPVMGSFGTAPPQPMMMPMGPGMGAPSSEVTASTAGPATGMAPVAMGMPVPRMPMMSNGVAPMVPGAGFMGAMPAPVPGGFPAPMPVRPGAPAASGPNMPIPHQSKLKYTQLFNSNDRNKKGSLTGVEARSILMNTGVPQQMLAQIWNLSDVNKDGKLDCEEFCIAMHLIDMLKMGQPLPPKLPPELLPSKGRSGSFGTAPAPLPPPSTAIGQQPKGNFGDLLGNMGMPAPVQPAAVPNGEAKPEEPESMATFEDKRKLNFDKGQAELERRRQMLQDQMKKENEARMEKERKEQEKREKQRQEQEMKRQQELERQLEKQRQIERQREEQRQKMMDQREAARRELERQRQMEWERQRKEQLMVEKAREYEQLTALKSHSSNLKCELESLQGKKTEIALKISQVKNGVTDFTAHIEAMRSTRDLKNKDIDALQKELQELNHKFQGVQADRQTLDLRVQTSVQSNPMSETHRTMMHSVELKRTSVQRLKKDLEEIEKETETKLSDIDTQNLQITEMNSTISSLQSNISQAEKQNQNKVKQQVEDQDRAQKEKDKHEKLRKDLASQRLKEETEKKQKEESSKKDTSSGGNWFDFGSDTKSTAASSDNWASVFDQPSSQASSVNWGAAFSSQNKTTSPDQKHFKLSGSKQKFKALYQFDARNEDELSLQPGDAVMVFDDQTGAEPGWKGGEMNAKCGWFPEAYVEKVVEESSQSAFGSSAAPGPAAETSLGINSSEDSSFMAVPGKMPTASPTPGQGQTAPEGLQAQALYPWKAKKDNHLTFNKGDVICVREQQDMWWSGDFNGKTGWFPKSYVKLIGVRSSTVSAGSSSSPAVTPVPPTVVLEDTARQSPAPVDKPAGDVFVAVYTYQSAEAEDLVFNQGEEIIVSKMDGDWWTGTVRGKTGIFPANYVKKQDVQPTSMSSGLTSLSSPPSFPGLDSLGTGTFPSPLSGSQLVGSSPSNNTDHVAGSFENDPFAASASRSFSADPFGANEGDATTSPFPEDPFGGNMVQDPLAENSAAKSPFPEDPFGANKVEASNAPLPDDAFKANKVEMSFGAFSENSIPVKPPNLSESTLDPFAELNVAPSENVFRQGQVGGTMPEASKSPFPEDPFGKTQIDSSDSAFSSDPFADMKTGTAKSPFEDDPFAEMNSAKESNKLSEDSMVSGLQAGVLSDPFAEDPFKQTAQTVGSSPFTQNSGSKDPVVFSLDNDPFKDSGIDLKPAMGSSTEAMPSAFSDDPFKDSGIDLKAATGSSADALPSAFSDDPFKDSGLELKPAMGSSTEAMPSVFSDSMPSAFSDDPFADMGNMMSPSAGADKGESDMFKGFSDADSSGKPGQSSAADPYAAFAGLGDGSSNPPGGSNSPFPDPPSGWFESVEKDANSSLPSDLGAISGTPSSSTNIDSSIQTSLSSPQIGSLDKPDVISDPFNSLMSPKPAAKPDVISDPFSSLMSSSNPPSLDSSKSSSSPFDDLGSLQTKPGKPARPPLPTKASRSRGSSLNQEGLDPINHESSEGAGVGEGPPAGEAADSVKTGSLSSTGSAASLAGPGASLTGTLKKPEIATVIAAYSATGEEQLSLNPGQLIQVRKKSPSGWWEGELQARGQKRKIGWFPANYVKLLGASARSTPDNTLTSGGKTSPAVSSTSSPAPQSSTPQPTTQSYVDHVIAIYPYTAQNPDELTFQKDAVINVMKKDDPDWWQGEYNGQTGLFPSNYVSSTTPEANSWSTDPQVLALTSQEESKRQSYIHELINTEETYMADMSIVLDAFYKPMEENNAMTAEQLQAVFVNWKDLIVCNTKLQKALRVRKKMCGEGQVINSIGDILCENIPHLTAYIRFCSCQLNAAALIQRLSETNPLFNEIHKKCVQNPKTKGMPLSSFLLKPMQRITKYPLIVEKILKYTPEGNPDHNHLLEALEHCQELCSQVNEGVREKENSDRLEWIQQHVNCENLPEKITFNSITNCLGPRKLLHAGVVYKHKSGKDLAAFLFNDFLLLTTSNRPLNSATHSVFDVTGQVQYKMYKSPIFLNEIMVKKAAGSEDTDTFQISHIDRMYHLRCNSVMERDNWIRKLEAASRNYLDTERKKREKAISSPKSTRGVGRLLVIIMEGSNLVCSKDVRRSPGVGRLLVVIIEGIDLQSSNSNGKSDPYCEVSMGAQEHKTKVINNTLNPKWNASMQFFIRDVGLDRLCITVFDRDLFSPNDFLGRTEIRVKDILQETGTNGPRGPVVKHLILHEVATGEVVVKLDLHLFDQT